MAGLRHATCDSVAAARAGSVAKVGCVLQRKHGV